MDPADAEEGGFENPERDVFSVATLREQSAWRDLERRVGADDLAALARDLTRACAAHPVDRWSVIRSGGDTVVARKRAFEDALRRVVGTRVQWRLVESDVAPFETGSAFAKYAHAPCGGAPTIWIQFVVAA